MPIDPSLGYGLDGDARRADQIAMLARRIEALERGGNGKRFASGRATITWAAATQAIVGINPGFGTLASADNFVAVAVHRQITGDIAPTNPISCYVENWTTSGFIVRVVNGSSITGTTHVDWWCREL